MIVVHFLGLSAKTHEHPISFIKLIREETGMSLKSAKEAFELLQCAKEVRLDMPASRGDDFVERASKLGYDCDIREQ